MENLDCKMGSMFTAMLKEVQDIGKSLWSAHPAQVTVPIKQAVKRVINPSSVESTSAMTESGEAVHNNNNS